jgi:hypothetical protein
MPHQQKMEAKFNQMTTAQIADLVLLEIFMDWDDCADEDSAKKFIASLDKTEVITAFQSAFDTGWIPNDFDTVCTYGTAEKQYKKTITNPWIELFLFPEEDWAEHTDLPQEYVDAIVHSLNNIYEKMENINLEEFERNNP